MSKYNEIVFPIRIQGLNNVSQIKFTPCVSILSIRYSGKCYYQKMSNKVLSISNPFFRIKDNKSVYSIGFLHRQFNTWQDQNTFLTPAFSQSFIFTFIKFIVISNHSDRDVLRF